MCSDEIILSVRSVTKKYEIYEKPIHRLFQTLCAGKVSFNREFEALKDVSFDVRRGECIGIVGRNGAGKSTLLQILAGTLSPTFGSVVRKGKIAALLELGSGFNPEFTGRENVYMNAAIHGLCNDEIDGRIDSILKFADIGEFVDRPVKTYSSGMTLRLAFAVIAHVDADILIIDEALAVGDAFFQQKCMRFLRSFMENHTVIFVSHDTGAVCGLCKRGVLLDGGRVKMQGSAKEVVNQYLMDLYAESQDVSGILPFGHEETVEADVFYRDMRADYINASAFRNDIEVFKFDSKGRSFGDGGATIVSVAMCDGNGARLSWIVGGEMVSLCVRCHANKELVSPIVGFFLRDRLGQDLFGDNTFASYAANPLIVQKNQEFSARFEFRMPYLAPGDYSVCVAIAEGSNKSHVQHQWMNEALVFRSNSTSPASGLIGIPMRTIEMTV